MLKNTMKSRILLCLAFCLGRVLAAGAQTYEDYVSEALDAVRRDSLGLAEDCLKRALALSPQDARNALTYNSLGKVRERLYWRRPEDKRLADAALDAYTQAIGLAPESVAMLMSRAAFYLRLDILPKALNDLDAVLDINPQNVEARNFRAYARSQRKEYAEARSDYERVLEVLPQNYSAQLGLAVLLQNTGSLGDAIGRMNRLVAMYPDSVELYGVRADMYVENRQPELALMDLDKAVRRDPRNVRCWLSRALLHKRRGNKRLALRDFEQAIALGVPRASLKSELRECR